MSVIGPHSGPRHVVVGPTREDAAARFGIDHGDMFLTSYEELGAEVDLDQVDSMDLAAGEGLGPALDQVSHKLTQVCGFSLRIEYSAGSREALTDILTRNNVVITDVQNLGGGVVLVLEAACRVKEPRTHTILSAIDAAADLPRHDGADGVLAEPAKGGDENSGTPTSAATTTRISDTPHPKRPRPPLLGLLQAANRWRNSRRRQTAFLGALAALALSLLALGMLSGSPEPVIIILLTSLILLLIGGLGLLLMTVLVLARQVHAQTGRIERMLLRNRTLVGARITAIERCLSEIPQQHRRLTFMHAYLEAMAAASSASTVRITDQIEALGTSAAGLHLDTQRKIQAVVKPHRVTEVRDPVPPLGRCAASADFDVLLRQELTSLRPRTVVECGSGATTLLLALAVKQHGLSTRVVALEHLETCKARTEQALRQQGVAELVEVRLAPLTRSSVLDHETPSYDERTLRDLNEIGLLVVDGSPEPTGDRAWFPAVPLLRDRMSASCVIVVDDLIRPVDLELVQSWRALLPDFEYEQLDTLHRRVGVFRR